MIYALIGAFLVILSGYHKAVFNTLSHHFFTSVFRHKDLTKWNPEFSSENKYEPVKWISKKYIRMHLFAMYMKKTVLSWTTDAWHRFQMYHYTCMWSGMVLIAYNCSTWYGVAIFIIVVRIQYGWVFEAFYSNFLIDQEEVKKRKYMEGLRIREDLRLDEIDEHDYETVMKLVDKVKNQNHD